MMTANNHPTSSGSQLKACRRGILAPLESNHSEASLRAAWCGGACGGDMTAVTGIYKKFVGANHDRASESDVGDPDHREADSIGTIGRTRIAKGALLFFKGQPGARGCNVTNVTNRGAEIRTHDLPVLPSSFDLTFDNFRTIRRCRLIWREGDFLGLAFEN